MPKSTETIATRAPRKSRSTKKHPTPEQIQLRAYEIYLERGGAPGNPLDDWIRAERELMEGAGTTARKLRRAPNGKIA